MILIADLAMLGRNCHFKLGYDYSLRLGLNRQEKRNKKGAFAPFVTCGYVGYFTLSNAWLTSAIISSMFSIPTEIRTKSALTPAVASSSSLS